MNNTAVPEWPAEIKQGQAQERDGGPRAWKCCAVTERGWKAVASGSWYEDATVNARGVWPGAACVSLA